MVDFHTDVLRGNKDVAQEAKQEDVPSAVELIKIQNPALDCGYIRQDFALGAR